MKTFTQSSRFIRPKKLEQCHDVSLQLDGSSSQAEIAPNTSPQSATDFNIIEEICSLEQQYSKSFSKWDNIRKMDEREHAIMQGRTLVPNDDDYITPHGVHAVTSFKSDNATNPQNVTEEADYGRYSIMKNDEVNQTTLQSDHLDTAHPLSCVTWFALLLLLLRVSHLLNSASYTYQ